MRYLIFFYYLWTIYLHVKTNNNLNYNLKTINYYVHEKKFLFYVDSEGEEGLLQLFPAETGLDQQQQ